MSVWLTIPSARPPAECAPIFEKWKAQGYKIAVWRDRDDFAEFRPHLLDYVVAGDYPGYAKTINWIIKGVMTTWPDAEWFVIGGDDVEPDQKNTAWEIGEECHQHFWEEGVRSGLWNRLEVESPSAYTGASATFGVMQPTGDRFAEGSIDRICGSAWLGREFCRRINQGNGPLWEEYVHNFVDEELQNVAIKYGIFQQRRDLVHLHHHFMRENDRLNSPAVKRETPAHLKAAFSPEGWGPYKAIFDKRKREGFPGSEPIA